MSFIGYKAKNHPQQVHKHGPRAEGDDRATTSEVFDPLNERFHFTFDVAASAENTKCERFYSIEDDGLAHSWGGERVWCNPPYSNIEPWIIKAHNEIVWGFHPAELIVMLLPANRTEQGWWQRQVEPYRDKGSSFRVEFLAGRLRFLAPGALTIKPNERPPFGCCLLIWNQL